MDFKASGILQAGPRVWSEEPRGALPGAGPARCGRGHSWKLALSQTAETSLARRAPPSRRPLPALVVLSVLSVAGSASRRLSAGCQASMIGPASDAFLPPPTRWPCGSPGSLPPLHSSSAHTKFPPRRWQPQTSRAACAWERQSEVGRSEVCRSPGTRWRGA